MIFWTVQVSYMNQITAKINYEKAHG